MERLWHYKARKSHFGLGGFLDSEASTNTFGLRCIFAKQWQRGCTLDIVHPQREKHLCVSIRTDYKRMKEVCLVGIYGDFQRWDPVFPCKQSKGITKGF